MKKKMIAILLIATLMITTLFNQTNIIWGAQLNLESIVDKTSGKTDVQFTYTIKYANPDTTNDLDVLNTPITVTIPNNMEWVSYDLSGDYTIVNSSSNSITFSTPGDLTAGKTGLVKVYTKFKQGITQNGDTAILTYNGQNAPTVTAIVDAGQITLNKTKTLPSANPALNSTVTYGISVGAKSTATNITSLQVVDTLPTGAAFVSTSDSGVYNATDRTVTWSVGPLAAGATKSLSVSVIYPDLVTDPIHGFIVGNQPVNTVTAAGIDLSNTTLSAMTSHTITLAAPTPGISNVNKSSRQNNDRYAVGQNMMFYINGFSNTGNVPLSSITLVDSIPVEMDLNSVSSGSYHYATGVLISVYYELSDSLGTWNTWDTNIPASENRTLNTTSLPAHSGSYITKVKWEFNEIPVNFSVANAIQVNGLLLANNQLGTPVITGNTVTNTVGLTSTYNNAPFLSSNDSETITVYAPVPYLSINKTTQAIAYELDQLTYTIRITNNAYALGNLDLTHGETLEIIDELPSFLDNLVVSNLTLSGTANTLGNITDHSSDKWILSNTVLLPGQYIQFSFQARIKDNTLAGLHSNTATITPSGFVIDDRNPTPDSTANTFVKFTGSIASEKLVKGALDAVFTKYPSSSTLSGGAARYQLKVSNTDANGPIANIVIIDKLPAIGDTGVIDTSARGSEWKPYLVKSTGATFTGLNGATLNNAITVYYTTASAIDIGQLAHPMDKTNYQTYWSTTPPSDITSVTALKFDFGNIVLQPTESVYLEWEMRAPVHAPSIDPNNHTNNMPSEDPTHLIAWNSFGYGATYTDVNGQEAFVPSEPIKVGIKIDAPTPLKSSIGDYLWIDRNKDGIQNDAMTMNGVKVNLYADTNGTPGVEGTDFDTPYAYTMTGVDFNGQSGYYLFPDLPSGKYVVEFEMPTGYFMTTKNSSNATASTDSDFQVFSGSLHRTDEITLGSDEHREDIDMGIFQKVSVGNYVWYDYDADGIQDASERGINDIWVKLYHLNGVTWDLRDSVQTTTVNGPGYYMFTGLDPGTYKVNISAPSFYAISPPNKGGNDNTDSDIATTGAVDVLGYTDPIILNSGDSDLSIDAGLYLGKIGDLIWHDLNANGIKNSGENGIAGVTVTLYNLDTATQASVTTNSSGIYTFEHLPSGNYEVVITRPNGYDCFTPTNAAGSNDTNDSDGAYISKTDLNATISSIVLSPGEWDTTNDTGLFRYATLGDKVFNDLNHNNNFDAGEPGISGVTVNLYASNNTTDILQTVTTNVNGNYTFNNLIPGSYKVAFVKPNGFEAVEPSEPFSDASASNSDADMLTGLTGTYILTSGQSNSTCDAGFFRARLGDYIWEDMNYDGIQNETTVKGVNGVVVSLYNASDVNTSIASMTTITYNGNAGYYFFEDLPNSTYFVKIALPNGYFITQQNIGSSSNDSNIDRITLKSDTLSLPVGGQNLTVDGGIFRYAKVGDTVWVDENYNGIQDIGEAVVNGATVELIDPSKQPGDSGYIIDSTTTNASGNYLFQTVLPGTYAVKFTLPTDYNGFTITTGGSASTNSDANSLGLTTSFTVESGDEINTLDAGVFNYAKLGNFIYEDLNTNGVHDTDRVHEPDEIAFANITLNLINPSKQPNESGYVIATTQTDASGHYLFDNLHPGSYKIQLIAPSNYKITTKDAFANGQDTVDSDFDLSTRLTNTIVLTSGEYNQTLDGGLYRDNSIGDFIWLDMNYNGIQDQYESGLSNVQVKLYNTTHTLIATTVTDSTGNYLFDHLPKGDYYIQVTPDATYFVTVSHGGIEANDSDIDQNTFKSDTVSLTQNTHYTSLDCGLYQKASLGDYVWQDTNANGIQDNGELPLSGVTVTLTFPNASTSQTTTDADGKYLFSNLDPGVYQVQFTTPSGFQITASISGNDTLNSDMNALGIVTNVTLITNQNRTDIDAGFYQFAKVGDKVWLDSNYNGIQDMSEVGVDQVTVSLIDPSKQPADSGYIVSTTTTDTSGNYLFDKVIPGTYKILFTLPTLFDGFTQIGMGNSGTDSNANPVSGVNLGYTDSFTVTSNDDIRTFDAGIYQYASIGNFVFEDTNLDGIYNYGEYAISNVTLQLIHPTTSAILATTTSSATGAYQFTHLIPGSYQIKMIPPTSYFVTTKDVASNSQDILDNDFNTASGMSDLVSLASGEYNDTIDGGLYKDNSIGNIIWLDSNYNGIQDNDEIGIPNVVIRLYNQADQLVSTTTTSSIGVYEFDHLISGQYYIEVVLPDSTYFATIANQGGEAVDSDLSIVTLKSDVVTLTQNTHYNDLDGGLYQKAALGDYVFIDTNANGIQDALDVPLANVQVTLIYPNNTTTQTLTDSNGYYQFNQLNPGTYSVQFTTPSGFVITSNNIGSDDLQDSDINSSGLVTNIVLTSHQNRVDIDAGYYQLGSIGNYIWLDRNRDGIQNEDEKGIQQVEIQLKDGEGNVKKTRTDTNGYYLFDQLKPNAYTLTITPPFEHYLTYDHRGVDDALDSNFDVSTFKTTAFLLPSGVNNMTYDGGLYYNPTPINGELGDYVWLDANADGIQDANEKGIAHISVSLYDSNGKKISETQTDSLGYYLFKELAAGTYTVKVSISDTYTQTYDYDSQKDNQSITALSAGGRMYGLDFGYVMYEPALQLLKTSDRSTVYKDNPIKYVITVKNIGNQKLTNIVINDPMVNIQYTINTLAIGESKTIEGSYITTLDDENRGFIDNTATATSNETKTVQSTVKVVVKKVEVVEEKPVIDPSTPSDPTLPEEKIYKPSIENIYEIEVITPPTKGEVVIRDGKIVYIPGSDFEGKDSVTIRITTTDGEIVEEIIEILEEDTPLGGLKPVLDIPIVKADGTSNVSALPKTAEQLPIYWYFMGMLFITLGLWLRYKKPTQQ